MQQKVFIQETLPINTVTSWVSCGLGISEIICSEIGEMD